MNALIDAATARPLLTGGVVIGVFALGILARLVRSRWGSFRAALKALGSGSGSGGSSGWRRLVPLLKALLYMVAVIGFTGSLIGMLVLPGYLGRWSSYVFAFGLGVLLIPAFVYLFGKSLGGTIMTPLARILFTIGTITQGGTALDRREYGRYEPNPLRKADDGTWEHRRDGEWVPVKSGLEYLTRLGTKPFAITYEKSDIAFSKWKAEVTKEDTKAVTDGGSGDYYLLDTVRAETMRQIAPARVVERAFDGFVVRMEAIRNNLRGAGGSGISDKAKEEALKEYGGNTEMGTKIMIAYVIIMTALGAATAVWVI